MLTEFVANRCLYRRLKTQCALLWCCSWRQLETKVSYDEAIDYGSSNFFRGARAAEVQSSGFFT